MQKLIGNFKKVCLFCFLLGLNHADRLLSGFLLIFFMFRHVVRGLCYCRVCCTVRWYYVQGSYKFRSIRTFRMTVSPVGVLCVCVCSMARSIGSLS